MNREIESMAMRPLAKDLTRSLEELRNITRDQALRDLNFYTERMREALRQFDSLFAEFELRYAKCFYSHLFTSICMVDDLHNLIINGLGFFVCFC